MSEKVTVTLTRGEAEMLFKAASQIWALDVSGYSHADFADLIAAIRILANEMLLGRKEMGCCHTQCS